MGRVVLNSSGRKGTPPLVPKDPPASPIAGGSFYDLFMDGQAYRPA